MNRRIICLTLDCDGDREDCNVFYSKYVVVEHPVLTFSEPLFTDDNFKGTSFGDVLDQIRGFGYTVHEYEQQVIVAGNQ